MKSLPYWLAGVVAVIGAGTAMFYLQKSEQVPVSPAIPANHAAPASTARMPPAIKYPIEESNAPLPALGESSGAILTALVAVWNADALALLQSDNVIRRIVTTVDNLPREAAAERFMPFKPVRGRFAIEGRADDRAISPANGARYAALVQMAQVADVESLVAIYAHFYPLFQRSFRDLGYPEGHFNDRLVDVIDHLLAAPEIKGGIRLSQPKVLYEFMDSGLESRSAGHKMMIRMGVENETRVKAKLREIRAKLVKRTVKP